MYFKRKNSKKDKIRNTTTTLVKNLFFNPIPPFLNNKHISKFYFNFRMFVISHSLKSYSHSIVAGGLLVMS